jgi:hypothetical protein
MEVYIGEGKTMRIFWRRYKTIIESVGITTILSVLPILFDLKEPYKTGAICLAVGFFLFSVGYCIGNVQIPGLGIVSIKRERSKSDTYRFIRKNIDRIAGSGNEINIDCMGIKSESIADFISANIHRYNWRSSNIRILLPNKDSEGIRARAIIADSDYVTLRKRIDTSLTRFYNEICTKYEGSCTVHIKLYDFLPSFYIIRINSCMLVSYYLDYEGYKCPYMILDCKKDSLFNHFAEFFNRVYNSELSYDFAYIPETEAD